MMFERGQLVIIPFPFSDLTTTKRRPVVLLTTPDENGDFICLAVTSKGYHAGAVPLSKGDLQQGILPKASWISTDKVFTLSASIIAKAVGQIKEPVMQVAIQGLCVVVK